METAPIVLFVYKRPLHTKQTLAYLSKNITANESRLFIFSDGPAMEKDIESVHKVRQELIDIKGFKSVEVFIEDSNQGLAKSVINGVSKIINEYKKVIVLEDDLLTSSNFLNYMNSALNHFEQFENVYSISAFNHPLIQSNFPREYEYDVYFSYRLFSYGWATWEEKWKKNVWDTGKYAEIIANKKLMKDFNRGGDDLSLMLKAQVKGKIDSWSVLWAYTMLSNSGFAVNSKYSMIKNIGFDGSGTHSANIDFGDFEFGKNDDKFHFPDKLIIYDRIINLVKKTYAIPVLRKLKNKLIDN
jgi:hypothetical protein